MIRYIPPQDLHKSGYVARIFALRDVALRTLSARRSMDYGEALADALSKPKIGVEDHASATVKNEGQSLLVRVQFGVTVSGEDDEVLAVTGSFDLQYTRQVEAAEFDEDDVQLFARINGVYNCWPYIREVVSSTFARLGYPPFTLDSLVIAPEPEGIETPAEV